MITVKVIEPDGSINEKEIEAGLAAMQKIVGGYIEVAGYYGGDVLIVNEEGVLMDLPINVHTPHPCIHGTAFLIKREDMK